jgi:hypothetical protein
LSRCLGYIIDFNAMMKKIITSILKEIQVYLL